MHAPLSEEMQKKADLYTEKMSVWLAGLTPPDRVRAMAVIIGFMASYNRLVLADRKREADEMMLELLRGPPADSETTPQDHAVQAQEMQNMGPKKSPT